MKLFIYYQTGDHLVLKWTMIYGLICIISTVKGVYTVWWAWFRAGPVKKARRELTEYLGHGRDSNGVTLQAGQRSVL
jgi:hypothetical protein